MVKDEGTEEIIQGANRYFLSFNSYSVNPDPLHQKSYVVNLYVPLRELSFNRPGVKQIIPTHPDCNVFDVDKEVIENVKLSIKEEFGEKGYFHLKNQGITIYADAVDISEGVNRCAIKITDEKTQGIIDGANLYNIIRTMSKEDLGNKVYVNVKIITGPEPKVIPEIITSLDTKITNKVDVSIDVKELDWLKKIVDSTEYVDKIDLVDVLCYINLFRNNIYDTDATNQPTISYWNKQQVIDTYKSDPDIFKAFIPIIKDILYLHDFINTKTIELWPSKLGSLASLGLALPYKQKAYEFPMVGKKEDYKFHEAITCVLLNGFRCFVIFNLDNRAQWSKDFSKIVKIYEQVCVDLLNIVKTYNKETGYNPHVLGKNNMLYSIIYKEMMMGDMLNQFL